MYLPAPRRSVSAEPRSYLCDSRLPKWLLRPRSLGDLECRNISDRALLAQRFETPRTDRERLRVRLQSGKLPLRAECDRSQRFELRAICKVAPNPCVASS